ncbi:hypothetical protein JCM19037_1608 [Geomicrobium sp. JCM 19037]|uniref:hypothetical protein n=1 Tax=Geomicrobium sp. JCM 19037 TaxID=1460634 RepID=UPI00045F4BBE|nr:hypothetical protein [Geomicrobium sp. JCM 19037]GAK03295.1 hypothetical protein JCM19037_1608 [Geomicrobium sp. JCM 19037]
MKVVTGAEVTVYGEDGNKITALQNYDIPIQEIDVKRSKGEGARKVVLMDVDKAKEFMDAIATLQDRLGIDLANESGEGYGHLYFELGEAVYHTHSSD